MNKSIYFIAILFSALLFGCKSDKPDDSPSPVINIGGAGKVYITCEGNYQFGNAKVSLYDKNVQQLLRIFISRLIILPWAMFVSQ